MGGINKETTNTIHYVLCSSFLLSIRLQRLQPQYKEFTCRAMVCQHQPEFAVQNFKWKTPTRDFFLDFCYLSIDRFFLLNLSYFYMFDYVLGFVLQLSLPGRIYKKSDK
jgi:hypothetical protein